MRILMLGSHSKKLIPYVKSLGDEIEYVEDRLEESIVSNVDFLVSYGYRFIIKENILNKFQKRAVNLHISYLPWNKGADPNLWSFLENTPKGVTIHYIDAGLDTGDIIAQKLVDFELNDTLSTSYDRLSKIIEELFMTNWSLIRAGQIVSFSQTKGGTYHRSTDKEKFMHILTNGWNTPVIDIIGKAEHFN